MLELEIISQAANMIAEIEKQGRPFTEREKHFIVEYAFKTGDMELVTGLAINMTNEKENNEPFMRKYSALLEQKEAWISQIENLLIALEMYRIEEERALEKITLALKACGVDVSVDEIKDKGSEEIKKMLKRGASI